MMVKNICMKVNRRRKIAFKVSSTSISEKKGNEINPRKGTEIYTLALVHTVFRCSVVMKLIPVRGRKFIIYILLNSSFGKWIMKLIPVRGRKLIVLYLHIKLFKHLWIMKLIPVRGRKPRTSFWSNNAFSSSR